MPADYHKLMSLGAVEREQEWSERDTMLYALGLGLGADPMDRRGLRFVTEKGLAALPTMATVLGWDMTFMPRTGLNLMKVVHGEQRLTLHRPLPTSGTMVTRRQIREVFDKGADKGALVLIEQTVDDKASGERLSTMLSTVFARGDGGFDGPTGSPPPLPETPEREPDQVCDLSTLPQAALIYRLSGDSNPLHSDPDFAAGAGFPRPILHGLCTYGVAGHAVLRCYCDYEPRRLKSFDVRFKAPVFPGETIRTEMWHEGEQVLFRSSVVEREVEVLTMGAATIVD